MTILMLLVGWACTCAVAVCCLIVLLKCIWNFGLPYAMLASKEEQGWSVFLLIEIVPLVIAMAISWVSGQVGWFAVSTLMKLGFGLIGLSYLHFCIVSIFAGIWQRIKTVPYTSKPKDDE